MFDAPKTIDDFDVEGRRVLVRVDFNVPLQPGEPGSAELPGVRALLRTAAVAR